MTSRTSIIVRILYNSTNPTINWCESNMKRVIKMSQAWIAAFALGILLTGCGGASDSADAGTGSGVSTVEPGVGGSVGEPIERAAVLSWSAPQFRANNQDIELYELDKYIIKYGQDSETLDREVRVPGEGGVDMAHKISDLDTGTWYFRISVEDTDGLRSAPSDTVEKTFES